MLKRTFLAIALLAVVVACGGGHQATTPAPVPAQGMLYTDPAGSGWRLVRDRTTTPTRLVLNLVGPAGLKTRGAGFNLQLPPAVAAAGFEGQSWPVRDLGVYELWNTDPMGDGSVPAGQDPLEPRLIAGGVKAGNLLTVGVFQKDRRATAKESGQPLLQIALVFDPAAGRMAGDALPLKVTKARHMGEDIGTFSVNPTVEMARKAVMTDMAVAVGTLRAQ